jgi:hypothetical protein
MKLNDSNAVSKQSRSEAKLILPFRALLALISLVGLLGWSYGILVVIAYTGKRGLVSPAAVMLLFGYVYLLLSLYSSFRKPSLKTLSIMGVMLNAPLVAVFIYALMHVERKLAPGAFVPVAYVLTWTGLWVGRWFVDHQISARRQVATIALGGAGVLLGAVFVWPLTIDHEFEAYRFIQAAFNESPLNTYSNFEEALRHAEQIRQPSQRTALLQQIAVAQAHRRLHEDSSNTIKTYLEKGLDPSDREDLLNSIVMAQIDNRDYERALTTARILNSSGRFSVQRLTLRAISTANAGKTHEARQILETAMILANEQVGTNQAFSFMNLAEAHSKIGFHDDALKWAQKVGPEHIFARLGSNGVNEAEAGYKDSARHTMQVIEETLDTSVRKCLRHPRSEDKDYCLSKLVDKLGNNRFFRLARATAAKMSSISSKDLAFRRISTFEAKYLNEDKAVRILQ